MSNKPILFSAAMVRALLDGRKTQTRRILKPQPWLNLDGWLCFADANWSPNTSPVVAAGHSMANALRWQVGDRLWVRETWRPDPNGREDDGTISVAYRADRHHAFGLRPTPEWKLPKAAQNGGVPGIHMPRWASRLTLPVCEVRVQRLQDISEEDAIAEGWPPAVRSETPIRDAYPIGWYANLWEDINGNGSWEANPWVVALTFSVELRNIDAPPSSADGFLAVAS